MSIQTSEKLGDGSNDQVNLNLGAVTRLDGLRKQPPVSGESDLFPFLTSDRRIAWNMHGDVMIPGAPERDGISQGFRHKLELDFMAEGEITMTETLSAAGGAAAIIAAAGGSYDVIAGPGDNDASNVGFTLASWLMGDGFFLQARVKVLDAGKMGVNFGMNEVVEAADAMAWADDASNAIESTTSIGVAFAADSDTPGSGDATWWTCTTFDGTPDSVADEGILLLDDTYQELTIYVPIGGSKVEFYIDGVLVNSVTANIPASTVLLIPILSSRNRAASTTEHATIQRLRCYALSG